MPRRTKKFARMMKETLTEYPQQTTIHGVKYLGDRSYPIAHRIYWIIIFIISFSLLGNFVYKMGRRWLEKEVMLIDESLPRQVYEIPFPAITICPQIKYKQDKFNLFKFSQRGSEKQPIGFEKKFPIAYQLCGSSIQSIAREKLGFNPRFTSMQYDWMDTLQEMAPSLEDVFESCQLMSWLEPRSEIQLGLKSNCRELFSMILTNEGVCFTFNTIRDVLRMDSMPEDFQYRNNARGHDGWDPDKGYSKANPNPYPYKAFVKRRPLQTNGLGFALTADRWDITDFCSYNFIPNVGYKIALHSATEYPQTLANFILLEYGKTYQIVVLPKTTRASIDLISVPPEVRGCYFNEERKLKYYTFYNEHNCRLECFSNFSMDYFSSVPIPLPRDLNMTLDLTFAQFGWEEPEYYDSINSHNEDFGVPNFRSLNFFRECKCLPACNSINYGYTVIEQNQKPDLYFVKNDVVKTVVDIIFNEPKFMGQKRVRLYTIDTMLSDFGGLLGLFIGGSILSLFELFYFFILRNCSKCSKSKVVLDNNKI